MERGQVAESGAAPQAQVLFYTPHPSLGSVANRMRGNYVTVASRAPTVLRTLFSTGINTLLTARGAVVVLIATLLIAGPVRQSSDVVASVVSYTLLSTLLVLLSISFIVGRRTRARLSLSLSADGTREVLSKEPCDTLVVVKGVGSFPFFKTEIVLKFSDNRISPAIIDLVGGFREDAPVPYTFVFPHRGRWELSEARVHFGDIFNLTRYSFSPGSVNTKITVTPPFTTPRGYPVVTSASVPGDMVHDLHRREGDPFDLKTYHPSDGMNRIVWKIYAKSGELFSRYPEASHTPSGEIAMFVVAGREDDHVCSAALHYIEHVQDMGLEIVCGTEGSTKRATTYETARELFIESVWGERKGERLRQGVDAFLAQLGERQGSLIEKLLIFVPLTRSEEQWDEVLQSVAGTIAARGVEPVFFLVKREGAENQPSIRPLSILSRLFLEEEKREVVTQEKIPEQFLQQCLQHQWQVEI